MMATPVFEEALRSRLQRKPFQPFVIELDTGERWVVGEREAVNYFVGDSALYFHSDGSFDYVDSQNVKQILDLVTAPPG